MGHESFVYGLIAGADRNPNEARANAAVIAGLPESDAWPFLTRVMFTIPPETVVGGHYRSQAIHFGASYKSVEWEWAEWLEKFEALLVRLVWKQAWVHLRADCVGDYDYRYALIDYSCHRPGHATADWRLRGGPRNFPFSPALATQWDNASSWIFAGGVWSPEDGAQP